MGVELHQFMLLSRRERERVGEGPEMNIFSIGHIKDYSRIIKEVFNTK